jgi:hypothetical protein
LLDVFDLQLAHLNVHDASLDPKQAAVTCAGDEYTQIIITPPVGNKLPVIHSGGSVVGEGRYWWVVASRAMRISNITPSLFLQSQFYTI